MIKTNIKITLIEAHEMVCNLLIPKTLIIAPRQCGKTESIKKAIQFLDYYKIFVANKEIIDVRYSGIKNVHLGKEFNNLDTDSVAYKIFVDDIDFIGKDSKSGIPYIDMSSPGIYAATSSNLNFELIQHLIRTKRFDFERICIVDAL